MPHSFTIEEAKRLYAENQRQYVLSLLVDIGGSIEHFVREAIDLGQKMASVDLPSELEGKIAEIRAMFPGFEIKVRRNRNFSEHDYYSDPDESEESGGKYLSVSGWAD